MTCDLVAIGTSWGGLDALRVLPRLPDQRPVLLDELPRLAPRRVGLLERAPDPLAALVEQVLDRPERVPLQHEEGDQEAVDRPDHQARDYLDQAG